MAGLFLAVRPPFIEIDLAIVPLKEIPRAHNVDVADKAVVAARKDRLVTNVLGGTVSTFTHGHMVVVDVVVHIDVGPVGSRIWCAVLLEKGDPVGIVHERVVEHLDIWRSRNHDSRSPQPALFLEAVGSDVVITNGRDITDLVKDARMGVARYNIAFEQGVVAVGIGPEPGSNVVVHIVVPDYRADCAAELGAAPLPIHLKTKYPVVGDLVSLDKRVGSYHADAQLAVVKNVVVDNSRTVASLDADAMIVSDLVADDQPIATSARVTVIASGVHSAVLRRVRILFDGQSRNRDVVGLAGEGLGGHTGFNGTTAGVIADIDAIGTVVEVPLPGPYLGETVDMFLAHIVDE